MQNRRKERFAERTLVGVDDDGVEETIEYWLEFRPGALWVVGRVVNPQLRENHDPRPDDVVYESYELDDALEHVNEALEDDLRVLESEGREQDVRPITRKEIEPKLERLFLS